MVKNQINLNKNGSTLEIYIGNMLAAEISGGRSSMKFAAEILEDMGYEVDYKTYTVKFPKEV